MPHSPKAFCKISGCSGISYKSGYCDYHYNQNTRLKDNNRLTATQRGYDDHWHRVRQMHLNEHPLCVMCEREGLLTKANVVDHIVPFRGDYDLKINPDNLQSLCNRHHNYKTARYDGGFGRKREDVQDHH